MCRRKYLIVLLTFFCQARATNRFLPESHNSKVSELSQCILDIVDKSDFFQPTLAFFLNEYQNNSSSNLINKIIEAAIQNNIPITITNKGHINNIIDVKYDNFIIIYYIENCDGLIDLSAMPRNKKYLVILHEQIKFDCNNTFLKSARSFAAIDMTFIYEENDNEEINNEEIDNGDKDNEENIFKLVTCIPILNPKTCKQDNNVNFYEIGTCRNGSIDKSKINIFPNKKPSNWMQCPMKVGMGALYPYVKSYNDSLRNLDVLNDANGSDVEIIKIMAKYYNASLSLYHIKVVPENIYLDLSFIPLISNGTLEVCAGGLYRAFGDIVSYSGIYSRQEVIWVYTVERQIRSWFIFIQKIGGIYTFGIFYIFYSIVWSIITYFDENVVNVTNTFFYSWGAILGTASLQNARTLKQKILNLSYLILCLYLSAYVSIQLYAFLTIQEPPYVYQNTDDLSASGKQLYLKDTAKYFVEDEKYLAVANTSDNCANFWDCVKKTRQNNGITLILDGLLAAVQTFTAESYEARILKATEAVLLVYHEMLIWKESLLVGSFEKVLRRLFEAGICNRLYKESIGILALDRARSVNQNMLSNSYSCELGCAITLSQCAGAFYVWITGCILSCFVFFLEFLIKRRRINYGS